MALKRITMQQLADACGLSRNTVSKVFNGRGTVPDATRQMVMKKAKELGYYTGIQEETEKTAPPRMQNIALLTSRIPVEAHFGTFVLPAFTEQLSRVGYTLTMYEISSEERRACKLPSHMSLDQTAGISIMELFDQSYLKMLCALKLPCISIDAYANFDVNPMSCDFISMENTSSSALLTKHLIHKGATRLGFVGDPNHCNSFRQRWYGFCSTLDNAQIPLDKSLCILEHDGSHYSNEDWLLAQIQNMPSTPDALVCANDFLAIRIMTVLKRLGLSIPDDIMVTGFDGAPQSAVVEPSLTTVQIPNVNIGCMAANILLERLKDPERPFCSTYVKTIPIWRNSTARSGGRT